MLSANPKQPRLFYQKFHNIAESSKRILNLLLNKAKLIKSAMMLDYLQAIIHWQYAIFHNTLSNVVKIGRRKRKVSMKLTQI